MNSFDVILQIKSIFASTIEKDDGSFYDESSPEFSHLRLPGTGSLDDESLTLHVQENLKLSFDGTLDSPENVSSYVVKKVEGPSSAFYTDAGMNMRSISVTIEVETKEDFDEIDFDDFFHVIVFELALGGLTFTFTRFDNYYSEVVERTA